MQYLVSHHDQEYWIVPGGNWQVKKKYSFKSEALKAYNDALEAIEKEEKQQIYSSCLCWRRIYGSKYPSL
jgi:hypothetical protein